MLPTAIFLFIPAPGPDRRLARESFSGLLRAIASLFRRGEVILVLLLFVLPSSSFSLTNLLSGMGADFRTPERTVSLINGVGVTFAGIAASLLGGPLCARLPLRRLYLGVGIVGGLFTFSLLRLPHNPAAFAVATIGQNAFQALAFTVGTALALRTVGYGNALAATEYSILVCAVNVPLVYMQLIDGHAYTLRGVPGAFMMDAGISIAVCAVLLGLLAWLRMQGQRAKWRLWCSKRLTKSYDDGLTIFVKTQAVKWTTLLSDVNATESVPGFQFDMGRRGLQSLSWNDVASGLERWAGRIGNERMRIRSTIWIASKRSIRAVA